MRRTVLIYGLLMAVTVAVYKYFEFQLISRSLSREIALSVIALLFTFTGIWVGLKVRKNEEPKVRMRPMSEVGKELGITDRELEVLGLLAEGLSNQEIADKLFISLPTVKTHSHNLYAKLDAKRRTQAIEKARNLGLLLAQTEV